MSSCSIVERRSVEWRIATSALSALDDRIRASIEAVFASQKTLEDVVRWGLAQNPVQMVKDVVIQDEYTHDVIVHHPSGLWLAYDVT